MTDELRDVSHTPPHDTRNRVQEYYERGPDAVADGGEQPVERPDDEPSTDEASEASADDDDGEPQTLKDVDHSPPDGEGAHHVYRRGEKRE